MGDRRRTDGPRVYRPSVPWIALFGASGVGLLVLGALLALGVIDDDSPPIPVGLRVGLGAALAVFGAVCLVALALDRIVLDGDTIELRQLGYGHHRLRRAEIRGCRQIHHQGMRLLVIERTDGAAPVKYGLLFRPDAAFQAWFEQVVDLDDADRKASEAALLASDALGATVQERAEALARARRVVRALNSVSLGVCAWGFLFPRPYTLVIGLLAVLPVLAIGVALWGRGVYSIMGARNDSRPLLIVALIAPGGVLMLRAMLDMSCLDVAPVAIAGLLAVLLATALAQRDAEVARASGFIIVVFLLLFHGWAAAAEANALLDTGAPETFEVEVRGEHVSNGRHRTAYLRLRPWGPVAAEDDYAVPFAVYDEVTVGDTVCVELHPGALRARWYTIDTCA